ncbi:dihydropteroate synthase [Desulfitibacter alkalitolerans]|uniref:dihydropteroate synthase n=1 Tax=Desulfitibacter alkalitolerans TaxID=264641 RepID=UPI000484A222|nr:dihydropteroate synthase [Desulfitibacter alkalitolerans]
MFNLRMINFKAVDQVEKYLLEMGVDIHGVKIMAPKALFQCIQLDEVPIKIAHILKQEMLSIGGEAAVARGVVDSSVALTSVLLMGTHRDYKKLIKKLKMQPFKLPELARHIGVLIQNTQNQLEPLKVGQYTLPIDERTIVMGILNLTPDSFSDGGKFFDAGRAVDHALKMVEEGADIIDVGAESTRPGHTPVEAEEELQRLIPVLERLLKEVHVPISVDTYKAATAQKVLDMGVHIINDIWGLQRDYGLADVAAAYGAPVIIMHNQNGTEYDNFMGEVIAFLRKSIQIAEAAGIASDKIIIDPGIGFGKTLEHNLEIMDRLDELKTLGKTILLGTSRKSMIGRVLDLPVEERVEGTAATVALGIARGASIIRIHDVKEMVRVCKMMDAMVRR